MLVEMDWLDEHLNQEDVRVIDCNFKLGSPLAGFEHYMKEHLPNAFYFDLETDLSGKVRKHGGRHPLPDLGDLSEKLSAAGIDESVTVVAYDNQAGAFASRFWWLLRYLGHEKVYILNGGLQHWKNKGLPVTNEIPHVDKRRFNVNVQEQMLTVANEIKEKIIGNEGIQLLDSREEKRYKGIEETVDKVAGHIPGAAHCYWKDNLQENGYWKSNSELKERFTELTDDREIIVYCGSGVTACPNIVALMESGFSNVKLYLGSWSDWITYPENIENIPQVK
ncbi:sulfurtransferase [Bacillus sp. FJAT-45350]|uniref:sulfurtransferase n=1 Tax=Bacillus sp. FJAT-45350 TaxID=2011014 RepID=UPI000BB8F178|nr:sulfurtransferase [Bacillus sp. FJAT-45350]